MKPQEMGIAAQGKRTVSIYPNRTKQWAVELSRTMAKYLKDKYELVKSGSGSSHVNVFIGGDGTFFYYFHHKEISGAMIIVGSNHTYLSQFNKDNWEGGISGLIETGYKVPLPKLEVYGADGRFLGRAINEAAFKSSDNRIVSISYSASGVMGEFRGDGLLIATPMGSTGYSYSAGGEIIPLGTDALAITPICPYLRQSGPVVSEASTFSVMGSKNLVVLVDNIPPAKKCGGEEITIRKFESGIFYLKAQEAPDEN